MSSTPPRRPRAVFAAALLVALLTTAPAVAETAGTNQPAGSASDAAAQTGTGRKVLSNGHLDMGPRFDHGRWTVQIRDDTGDQAVWRNLSDVVLQANNYSRVTVPDDPDFAFLGRPGEEIWLLPQVQREGVLWPGWNSQDPTVAATVDREVTWRLNGVQGAGHFLLYLNEDFGAPKILFDSGKRFPQETGIEVDSHVHGNWVFSRPGTYLLNVQMKARTKAGAVQDDRETLRFSVGSQDPAKAFAAQPSRTPPAAGDSDRTSTTSGSATGWIAAGAAAAAAAAWLLIRGRRRQAGQGIPPDTGDLPTDRNTAGGGRA